MVVKKKKVGETFEDGGYRYRIVEIREDGSIVAERIGKAIEIEISKD